MVHSVIFRAPVFVDVAGVSARRRHVVKAGTLCCPRIKNILNIFPIVIIE